MSWSVRILDDEDDEDQPGEEPPPEPRRRRRFWPADGTARVAILVAAVIGLGTVVSVLTHGFGGAEIEVVDVDSYWDRADLTCRTAKLSEGRRSVETFRCEPTTSVEPPPGRYTQATTTWQSDIDRRAAVAHDIVITPDGSVSGWALY
jgi:hypothetical protein